MLFWPVGSAIELIRSTARRMLNVCQGPGGYDNGASLLHAAFRTQKGLGNPGLGTFERQLQITRVQWLTREGQV